MSLLVSLPHSLLHSILSGWLELHSVTKLDSAFCNRSLRESFVEGAFQDRSLYTTDHYFGKPKTRMHHLSDEKSDELMSWVLKRRVVIADLAVTDSVQNNTVFRRALLDFMGKHVSRVCKWSMSYRKESDCMEVVKDICERCPNVTVFCCAEELDDSAYKLIGQTWPSLSSITLGFMAKESEVMAVGKYCKNLTLIDITSAKELSSKVLCNLLKNTGAMLETIRGITLPPQGEAEVLRAIAQYCPKLCKVGVNDSAKFGNLQALWIEVFVGCPLLNDIRVRSHTVTSVLIAAALSCTQLQHLHMTAKAALDPFAVSMVATKCPNLRTLNICDQYGSIDDEALIVVADRCPLLEELSVMWLSSQNTSDAAAFAMAKTLRKLTHLALPGSGITDAGLMAVLARNPGIVRLDVHDCRGITDKTMKALPHLCPYISDLTTYKCKVKIAGVHAVLQGCRHLVYFQVPTHLLKKTEEAVKGQYRGICHPGLEIEEGGYVCHFG